MVQIQLLVVSGEALGTHYTVPAEGAIIGRSSKCDFTINEGILSRQHCRCYVQQGEAYVQDLESANGTLVNGEDIGVLAIRLKDGDILTLGATVIRVQLVEVATIAEGATAATVQLNWSESSDDLLQANVNPQISKTVKSIPCPEPSLASPPKTDASLEVPEDLGAIDLGLGDPTDLDVSKKSASGSSSKKILRLLIVALVALVTMIAMIILYEKMTKVDSAKDKDGMKGVESMTGTAQSKSFDIAYEHLLIQPTAIFNYKLNFSSATGILSLHSESYGETDRSFEEKKQLSEQEQNRLRDVFIDCYYEQIPAQYPEKTMETCSLDRKHIHFVSGHKVWERTSENYASHDYEKLCVALETCAGDLLNLKAAQYSVDELLNFARSYLDDAEAYWLRIAQGDENLCKSYENYCEAEAYLRTINPKPEFAKDIQRGVDKTRDLMDERYNDYKLTVDQAYYGRDEELEARALGKIMRLLPTSDERYRQAETRLEILEGKRRY